MSPVYRSCTCGQVHLAGTVCPERERRRNAVPARVAHRTVQHRKVRAFVLARDRGVCRWCGGVATECDYLVSLSLGGPMTVENAVAACKPCNARRGANVRRNK